MLFSLFQKLLDPERKYAQRRHSLEVLLEILRNEQSNFRQQFKITRETFWIISNQLQFKDHGWSKEAELLLFLYWLGCGSPYREISSVFGIPKSTIGRIIKRKLNEIVSLQNLYITFPREEAAISTAKQGFIRLGNSTAFCNVIGAIARCHIEVVAPKEQKAEYLNRKQTTSVQLQAICNDQGYFMDIFVCPGSVHESQVLRLSPVYQGNMIPENCLVLGDVGYPCLSHPVKLITPFLNPHHATQFRFNYHHSWARSIVERALGMVKARWGSIFTKCTNVDYVKAPGVQCTEVDYIKAPGVLAACAILHNISLQNNDVEDWNENYIENENEVYAQYMQGEESGEHIRATMSAETSPSESVDALMDHDCFA